jgi:hypothetical protein
MRRFLSHDRASYLRSLLYAGASLTLASCSPVSVDVRPNARTVEAGDTAPFGVFISRRFGYMDPVPLDLSPASSPHYTATVQPATATGNRADLTVEVSPDAPIGAYDIDVLSRPSTPTPWYGAPPNRARVVVGPCGAQWIEQFGTANGDSTWSTRLNAAGDIFGAVYQGQNHFVMRWDGDGALSWAAPILPGHPAWLDVDQQGRLVIAARTVHDNMLGYMIRRYTPFRNPNPEWTVYFGDDPHALAVTGVATDAAGNVYVVGITSGDLAGSNPDRSFTNWEGWVAAYDSAGNQLWIGQAEHFGHDSYEEVVVDNVGAVFVRGTRDQDTVFVRKFDAVTGEILHTEDVSAQAAYREGALAADSAGNVYVAFHRGTSDPLQPEPVLIKYDASLVQLWSRPLLPQGIDVPLDMAIDAGGAPIVVGRQIVTISSTNAAVAKFDANGTPAWNLLVQAPFHTSANSIALDAAGDMYIAGDTEGGFAAPNQGYTDAWLAKIRQGGCKL